MSIHTALFLLTCLPVLLAVCAGQSVLPAGGAQTQLQAAAPSPAAPVGHTEDSPWEFYIYDVAYQGGQTQVTLRETQPGGYPW